MAFNLGFVFAGFAHGNGHRLFVRFAGGHFGFDIAGYGFLAFA